MVVSVFAGELLIMLVLAEIRALSLWSGALVDASVLLVLLLPALYFFVYRPQARHLHERDRDATALQIARDKLEADVAARTAELTEANSRLETSMRELAATHLEVTLLAEMIDLFQACRTSEEAYAVIARCAEQLFPGESGELFVFKASRNVVESVARWGPPFTHERCFEPEECWGLRRGRAHVVESSPLASLCRHIGQPSPAASLCVPMMAQGTTLGVLTLQRASQLGDASPVRPPLRDYERLAGTASEHIALALASLNLRETLRHQAVRDQLTGLFNRRYLEETLEREVRRAERRSLPLAVIMLDIDHFKRFNDTFGHEAGDALLREVGGYLRTHVRPEDIACRYGGEEFTLILPDAPLEPTRRRADELRQGIARLGIEHRGQPLGAVTISMGVALFPAHGTHPDMLLRVADRALYRAKEQGRDCVIVAEQPPEPDRPPPTAAGHGPDAE